jgi:benzodiazapine receptor
MNMGPQKLKRLVVSLAIPQLAGLLGSIFTAPAIPGWYASLVKPAFNPPNWIFAPVWTSLFFLMGISLFLVWERKGEKFGIAVLVFGVQLALNVLWSILFFGLQSPFLALLEIFALWIAIVLNIYVFYGIDRRAAYLLVPYLAWVSFAAFLNYSIWVLN